MEREHEVLEMSKGKKIIIAAICIVIAVVSCFVITNMVTSETAFSATKTALDAKKNDVLKLTASSAALSTAISVLPGDAATPLANKLMDLSSYFIVILIAIYLEKFLLVVTGFLSFRILIPIGFALLAIYQFAHCDACIQWARKCISLGIILFLLIPISVKCSDLIEANYGAGIEAVMQNAQGTDSSDDVESETEDNSAVDEETDDTSSEESEDAGFFTGLINSGKDAINSAAEAAGDLADNVTSGASEAIDNAKLMLNRFMEAIAIMIVTSCLIPILVLLLMFWAIKTILGVDIPMYIPGKHIPGKHKPGMHASGKHKPVE